MEHNSIEYCENCKREIAASNFLIHSLHCQRNLEICKICHEPFPTKEMDRHIAEMHAVVSCEKCNKSVQNWQLQNHELECPKRPISCLYCEISSPWDEMKAHELYCGTRTERCAECQQYVMLKDKKVHEKGKCRVSEKTGFFCVDCKLCVQGDSEAFEVHKRSCFASKKELQKVNQWCAEQNKKLEYPKRQISCLYCEISFPWDEMKAHESCCGSRTERCAECQQYIMLKDKKVHEKGKCRVSGKTGIFCFDCKLFVQGDSEAFEVHKRSCSASKNELQNVLTPKKAERQPCGDIAEVISNFSKLSTSDDKSVGKNINSAAENHVSQMSGSLFKSRFSPKKMNFPKRSPNDEASNFMYTGEKRRQEIGRPQSGSHRQNYPLISEDTRTCPACNESIRKVDFNSHVDRCGRKLLECDICHKMELASNFKKHLDECYEKFLCGKGCIDDKSFLQESGMVKCPVCRSQCTSFEIKDHLTMCRSTTEECHLCHEKVPLSQRTAHQEVCSVNRNLSTKQKYSGDKMRLFSKAIASSADDRANDTSIHRQGTKFLEDSGKKEHQAAHAPSHFNERGERSPALPMEHNMGDKRETAVLPNRPCGRGLRICLPQENKESSVMCPQCNSQFRTRFLLNLHMKECSNIEKCMMCEKPVLVQHLKQHQEQCAMSRAAGVVEVPKKNDGRIFRDSKRDFVKCLECKRDISLREIRDHMNYCAKDECSNCHQMIRLSQLQSHKENCVKDKGKPNESKKIESKEILQTCFVKCLNCDRTFSLMEIDNHILGCRSKFEICPICHESVSSADLEVHQDACFEKQLGVQQRCNTYRQESEDKQCHLCECPVPRHAFYAHVAQCKGVICIICEKFVKASEHERHMDKCGTTDKGAEKSTVIMSKKQKRKLNTSSKQRSLPMSSSYLRAPPADPVLLPCEFCQELFLEDSIIEHQSGCKPELLHYPRQAEEEEEYFSAPEDVDYGKKRRPRDEEEDEFVMAKQDLKDRDHHNTGYNFNVNQDVGFPGEGKGGEGSSASGKNFFSNEMPSNPTYVFGKMHDTNSNQEEVCSTKQSLTKDIDKYEVGQDLENSNDLSMPMKFQAEANKNPQKTAANHRTNPKPRNKAGKKNASKRGRGRKQRNR